MQWRKKDIGAMFVSAYSATSVYIQQYLSQDLATVSLFYVMVIYFQSWIASTKTPNTADIHCKIFCVNGGKNNE